jgi:hypothetical protein
MLSEQRKKRSERARLSTLSATDRRAIQQLSAEKRRVTRVQQPDFVSAVLCRWRLSELVRNTKLLLILMNRTRHAPPERQLHGTERLLYYRHHSEYYDTLFAEYAQVWCGDDGGWLCFRAFYNAQYSAAKQFLALPPLPSSRRQQTAEAREHHLMVLRACFVCALTHDERVKRFVFARHDIHTHYLHTVPPCPRKSAHFITACRAPVNRFFHGVASLRELHDYAVVQWEECYSKRAV